MIRADFTDYSNDHPPLKEFSLLKYNRSESMPKQPIAATPEMLKQAIEELKIDVPVLSYELKSGVLILHLLGGKTVTYRLRPSIPQPSPIPQKHSGSGKGVKAKGK
jgi:hypothetical protein